MDGNTLRQTLMDTESRWSQNAHALTDAHHLVETNQKREIRTPNDLCALRASPTGDRKKCTCAGRERIGPAHCTAGFFIFETLFAAAWPSTASTLKLATEPSNISGAITWNLNANPPVFHSLQREGRSV
jgi:hypothetical protein